MSFTADQLAAFDDLKKRLPEDLVSGYANTSSGITGIPESEWVKAMRLVAQSTRSKAASGYNVQKRSARPLKESGMATRVLSADGFPDIINVSYAEPPRLGYMAPSDARDIRHIVLHSFGHTWHADSSTVGRVGWLNAQDQGRGAVPYTHNGSTVYIAKGSDPTNLTHKQRVAAGLQAILGPQSRAGMHFVIDRAGNLVVVGDVNYVMFSSAEANDSAVSIALEEALYAVRYPGEEKARWSAEGVPPGTGGNVDYFAFSAAQLLTLSIVCRKLEVAFNIPQTVSISRRSLTSASAPGYSIHDFIKGADRPDVSPHFLTQSVWDSFFALVSAHTNINATNLWRATPTYVDMGSTLISAPITGTASNGITDEILTHSKYQGIGYARSLALAGATRREFNLGAGRESLAEARKLDKVVANVSSFTQQSLNLPVSWVKDDLSDDEQGGWDDTWYDPEEES